VSVGELSAERPDSLQPVYGQEARTNGLHLESERTRNVESHVGAEK
jgi:hypothetical protein